MAAPLLKHETPSDPQEPVIALVRLAMLTCRTAPRGSVEACGVLDPRADASDFVVALSRTLSTALLRRPVFWRPGTTGRSFDEDWLLALALAIRTGDADSERFLLARRVHPRAWAILRMLIIGLFDRLKTD